MKNKKALFISILFFLVIFLFSTIQASAATTTIDGATFTQNTDGTLTNNGHTFSYDGNVLHYQTNGQSYIATVDNNGSVAYKGSSNTNHIISTNGTDLTVTKDTVENNVYTSNGTTYAIDSSGNSTPSTNNQAVTTQTSCIVQSTGQTGMSDASGNCIPTLDINANKTTATPATSTSTGLVPCGHGDSPANACTLCFFIIGFKNIISFALTLLITVSLVGIFISGVMYIVSSGTALLEQAKKFLAASLTGFAIVLAAWLIVNVVMWAISFDTNVGIGKTNWYTFTCT